VQELPDNTLKITFRKPESNPEVPHPKNLEALDWPSNSAGTRQAETGTHWEGVAKSFKTEREAREFMNNMDDIRNLPPGERKGLFPNDDHSVGKTPWEYFADEPAGMEVGANLKNRAAGGYHPKRSHLFKISKDVEMCENEYVVVSQGMVGRDSITYLDPRDPGGLLGRDLSYVNETPWGDIGRLYLRTKGEANEIYSVVLNPEAVQTYQNIPYGK